MSTESKPDIADLIAFACFVKILNDWAKPGNYWFVMPPRPGRDGPHTLYMSSGKAFEGKSHDDVIEQGARYLQPTLVDTAGSLATKIRVLETESASSSKDS